MVPDTRTRLEAALADLEGVLVCVRVGKRERGEARAILFPFRPRPTSLLLLASHLLFTLDSFFQDSTPADAVEVDDLATAKETATTAKAKLAA